MQFTIIYDDGHSNVVLIAKDKMFNTFRYINLTKEHICQCQFPNLALAIKDLLKYSEIKEIKYEDRTYNVIDFVRMFYFYEEV